jgi:hypothetical protein
MSVMRGIAAESAGCAFDCRNGPESAEETARTFTA